MKESHQPHPNLITAQRGDEVTVAMATREDSATGDPLLCLQIRLQRDAAVVWERDYEYVGRASVRPVYVA